MCIWMASDDDFFIVRRFDKLGARVLLLMQNRIAQLEEELQAEDIRCTNDDVNNGTFSWDRSTRRREVMDELVVRLERYREYIHRLAKMTLTGAAI